MYYVYILRSEVAPQAYTGYTKDLKARIKSHNYGQSKHTSKYRPWKLVAYFAFDTDKKARDFEAYLKTGSGVAFAKRHF